MKRSTLVQLGLSLLLGSLLCWVAMRDWQWGDILDTLRPLPRQGIRLLLPAEGLPPPGTVLQLQQGGRPLARVASPAPPLRIVSFPAPDGELTGAWQVLLPGGEELGGWALDFRNAAEREAAGRPAILPERPPEGTPSPTSSEKSSLFAGCSPAARDAALHGQPGAFATDPLIFPAHPGEQGRIVAWVRQVDWFWLIPYILLFTSIHLLRIVRWGVLLEPLGRLSMVRLVAIGSVGFMAILLFPLRLGEFIRPYLVSRESSIRMTSALATCVVERVIDGLAVVFVLFLVLALLPRQLAPRAVFHAGYLALAVFLASLSVLLAAHFQRELTMSLLHGTVGKVAPGLTSRISGLLSTFIDGLKALPTPGSLAIFLGQTTVYWLLIGLSFWTLFRAVGITLPDGSWPGLLVACAVMAILAIGIILPGGPAFAGSFEVALSLGLGLFLTPGMLATRGAAYILLLHTLQFVLQVAIGLVFLFAGGVSLRRVVQDSQTAAMQLEQPPLPLSSLPRESLGTHPEQHP